jgi:regulator of protease activity HflC (stomatin/prohibitin superfamily)
LFRKFGAGLDKENIYGQGFHVIAPWNTLIPYEVRLQSRDETMDVLTKNGLSIALDLSIRFQPIEDKIGYLHDNVGIEYVDRVIIPEIRSATRQVVGRYSPEELYSEKREQIQKEIFENCRATLNAKYINLDVVLIRSIKLPETIQTAIQSKLKQEQESQEYDFRIQKETKEAERKRIEANGIKEYQNIVAQSLSDKLLKWQGIEATKELSHSPNAKIVVIGGGDNGLPLILGDGN